MPKAKDPELALLRRRLLRLGTDRTWVYAAAKEELMQALIRYGALAGT